MKYQWWSIRNDSWGSNTPGPYCVATKPIFRAMSSAPGSFDWMMMNHRLWIIVYIIHSGC